MLVDFYHLTASPLERVLPQICEKVLGSGERLVIVAGAALLDQLDGQLWSSAPDSFLPHGRASGPGPENQPILLSEAPEPLNGASNVALADGEWRDEALVFARTFFLFDGGRLDAARQAWRMLGGKPKVERRYWKQVQGRWVEGP